MALFNGTIDEVLVLVIMAIEQIYRSCIRAYFDVLILEILLRRLLCRSSFQIFFIPLSLRNSLFSHDIGIGLLIISFDKHVTSHRIHCVNFLFELHSSFAQKYDQIVTITHT